MGIVLIPLGPVGVRPGRALRQADRQAEAGRLTGPAADAADPGHRRARLGCHDWAETFAPFAAGVTGRRGSWPSIARPRSSATTPATGRRPCRGRSASRPSPRPTSRRSATGSRSMATASSPPSCPAASTFKRMAADASAPAARARRRAGHGLERRRRPARRRPRQRLQPAPHRALPRRGLVERGPPGRRAQQGGPRRRRRRPPRRGRGDRPGRRDHPGLGAGPGAGLDDCRAHLGRARRPPSSDRRASASRPSSTRSSARSARRPRGPRDPTRAVATRRPTGSCSSCPAARLLVDTPGIRALEVLGADAGLEAAFDDVAEIAAACRFSDCAHEREPGCAVRVAIEDGRLDEARLASHRKLEREMARDRPPGRPARPGRAPPDLADHPQVRQRSTWSASTETTDDQPAERLEEPAVARLERRQLSTVGDPSDYGRWPGSTGGQPP